MKTKWIAAAVVGVASAAWAAFQWQQLLVARSGGVAFCPLGDGTQCSAIWDGPFAAAVQAWTVLPVAAWGVVWGGAAALMAAGAAFRGEPFRAGALLTALGGLVATVILAGASLASGGLCTTCAITYLGVGVYAALVLATPRPWFPDGWQSGALAAVAATLVGVALAYGPASATPGSTNERLEALVADGGVESAGAEGAAGTRALADLLNRMEAREKQLLSDVLEAYRKEPVAPAWTPRHLEGPVDAPVRITDWLDPLCGHCKNFHRTVASLRQSLGPQRFGVETRNFPLDAGCNRLLEGDPRNAFRCELASAIVCAEASPQHFAFTGALLEAQASIDPARLRELAGRLGPVEAFESCLASEETAAKLAEDVDRAEFFEPTGTPLVVVNGRKSVPWGAFLYAMILADGDPDHALFASLPPPEAFDPHAGHDH